jgi:hypothetical protein
LSFVLLSLLQQPAFSQGGWAKNVTFPKSEKPQLLFNGHDLEGWEGQKYWSVTNGVIRGANETEVPASSYLFTRKSYRNFRLLLEVKQTRGPKFSTMHSAVAALGQKLEDKGDPFGFKGPLLMFCNDWGIWDAHGRNRIYPPRHNGTLQNASEKTGDWNQIEILVLGDHIRMVANGSVIIDFTDQPQVLKSSPIGLQLHANAKPQEYHFRGLILAEDPEDRLVTLKAKE